jgi:hypothetical protein
MGRRDASWETVWSAMGRVEGGAEGGGGGGGALQAGGDPALDLGALIRHPPAEVGFHGRRPTGIQISARLPGLGWRMDPHAMKWGRGDDLPWAE